MNPFWIGLLAGGVATVPMTLTMMFLFRRLPPKDRHPLPPREITMELANQAGVKPRLDPQERTTVTLLAHFAYGMLTGAIYALLAGHVPGGALVKGIAFGLLVWAGSYLVLLPALAILRSAAYHTPRRNALMIAAHVVWGAALGWLVEVFSRLVHAD